jgi:hypothetical protein
MTGIQAPEAAREIEKDVAIDVDKARALGTIEEDAVSGFRNASGDDTPPLVEKRAASRARHSRLQPYRATALDVEP